jgi:hypothetical protein
MAELKQDVQRNVINHALRDMDGPAPQEMSLGQTILSIGGDIWDAAKPMFDHGRTEMAAAILGNHQGHVMYMHTDKEVEQQHQQEENELER